MTAVPDGWEVWGGRVQGRIACFVSRTYGRQLGKAQFDLLLSLLYSGDSHTTSLSLRVGELVAMTSGQRLQVRPTLHAIRKTP